MNLSVRERIQRKTAKDAETGCWIWQGYRDPSGYGRLGIGKKTSVLAHRAAWEAWGHPAIESGYELHHVCENRACCNPSHLRCVTKRAHRTDLSKEARITHCPYGHAYPDTMTVRKDGRRERTCRPCSNRRVREFYQRNPDKYRAHIKYGIELRRHKTRKHSHLVSEVK